jgi:hypothetical protein
MTHRTELALAVIVALLLIVSVGFDIAAEYRKDGATATVARTTHSHNNVR